MNLGDFFPDDLKAKFAENNIDIGQSILIKIPGFQVNYDKYIVVVALSDTRLAFVVINSEININLFPTEYLKSLHVPIDAANHPFLDHDSYINCSALDSFERSEIIQYLIAHPEKAVGNVNDDILRKIHYTLSIATTIKRHVKREFGF